MTETTAAPAPTPVDTTTTPAAPLDTVPAVSDLLQPQQMTVEQAQAKRVELIGDPGFRQRVLAGDDEANKQWKAVLHAALSPPVDSATAEDREYNRRMNGLAYFRAKAQLPEIMYDHVASNSPVSLAEREEAQFAKQRLFSDRGFVEKLLSGDIAANSEMTRIKFVLGSPIGSFEEIEAAKAKAAKRMAANGRGR
jgi:hypothetical protein